MSGSKFLPGVRPRPGSGSNIFHLIACPPLGQKQVRVRYAVVGVRGTFFKGGKNTPKTKVQKNEMSGLMVRRSISTLMRLVFVKLKVKIRQLLQENYNKNFLIPTRLHHPTFFHSYLIFWILMECGIAHFGQRGPSL